MNTTVSILPTTVPIMYRYTVLVVNRESIDYSGIWCNILEGNSQACSQQQGLSNQRSWHLSCSPTGGRPMPPCFSKYLFKFIPHIICFSDFGCHRANDMVPWMEPKDWECFLFHAVVASALCSALVICIYVTGLTRLVCRLVTSLPMRRQVFLVVVL